jgi:D-3-phosphoglycerate dehydrogenase
MKKKILITERFAQDSLSYLLQQSPGFEILKSKTPGTIDPTPLATADALLIRSKTLITDMVFQQAKKLQLIITCTSGFDHIDLDAAAKWGVTVMHTPTSNIESTAQLTWSLVLACCSRILEGNKMVKAGLWDRNQLIGQELAGQNYGIIGLGRIGTRVAQMAQAFGMTVAAYDPYQEQEVFLKHNIARLSYEEILRTSDVISFHVPQTQETKYMLRRSHFEFIRRGTVLINTSRGLVIHEADLCEALEQGWIRSAGLDVFEKEPLPRTSKLLNFPQVILTPHIGANTEEAFHKASQSAAIKCVRFFADGTTSETLPPKAVWYGAPAPFAALQDPTNR